MRGLMIVCVVALALVSANVATAADVSDQTLATMGLDDMATMSDAQGLEVRGLGFVAVSGYAGAYSWGASAGADYVGIGHQAALGGALAIAAGKCRTTWAVAASGVIVK